MEGVVHDVRGIYIYIRNHRGGVNLLFGQGYIHIDSFPSLGIRNDGFPKKERERDDFYLQSTNIKKRDRGIGGVEAEWSGVCGGIMMQN